jgi:transposase
LDKGFYSQANVREMDWLGLKFIIPLSFSTKLAKQLATDTAEKIDSPLNGFSHNGQVYFHVNHRITLANCALSAHIYLDQARRAKQVNKLLAKIDELEKKVENKNFKNKKAACDYIEETFPNSKLYFTVRKSQHIFKIYRNEKAIANTINTMGKFIILTNLSKLDKKEVLSLYRQKDNVEKTFQAIKNEFRDNRIRTKGANTMKGKLFILFITSVLKSSFNRIAADKNLFAKYTSREMFLALKKIKLFELANKTKLISEVSKLNKEILDAYKIKKPTIPSYNFSGF